MVTLMLWCEVKYSYFIKIPRKERVLHLSSYVCIKGMGGVMVLWSQWLRSYFGLGHVGFSESICNKGVCLAALAKAGYVHYVCITSEENKEASKYCL